MQTEPTNVNEKTAQIVKMVCELGPDIPEISRRLGQFKESVRYRYKEKILNRGFAVQASADHEKVGLRRMIVLLDFAPDYAQFAESILTSMHELCFLVGFVRTLPKGFFIANFSVPRDSVNDLTLFLKSMQERGMFSKLEVLDFEWFRNAPMKAEYYDFDTGRWDFDWSAGSGRDYEAAKYAPATEGKFDQVDLLLIKELQIDANKSLKEIADSLKINYKKLAWHYSAHVLERKLISGYSVNWMGTSYDYGRDKALHRQHHYFALQLVVKGVSEFESMSLRQEMDRLPYLWSESVGRNYSAEFAFPVDFVVEGLQYLTRALVPFKDRAEVLILDQSEAISFTIPYYRYDPAKKAWTFDLPELTRKFDMLILQIKKESH